MASDPGAILIVEDGRESAEMLQGLLEWAGFSVSLASDAFDAVRQVRCLQPAYVLLDVPSRSATLRGLELCSTLRDAQRASSRIIAVTEDLQISESRLLAAGFDGVVYKPVDFEHLLRLIIGASAPALIEKCAS